MALLMILEGGSTKVAGVLIGVSSLALGVAETSMDSLFGPLNLAAGGTLLVAMWVGQRVSRVAEKFFEEQGSKLIALPTAAQIEADKRSLFAKIEGLATEARSEWHETAAFRRELSATLADHGARLTNLERNLHEGKE